MIRVNERWLQRWCEPPLEGLSPSKAYDIAAEFGPLADWWLTPEVLKLKACYAASHFPITALMTADRWHPPSLPQGCGDCWVVLANERPERLPLLRAGRVLPLRWAQNAEHDVRLPAGLLQVADQVVDELRREDVEGIWGLRAATEDFLQRHDLSGLEGDDRDYGSVWVPLAAGLLLAAYKGKPDPAVWSSGAWLAGKGIQPIAELEAKLEVAVKFGAKTFFVPEPNVKSAQSIVDSGGIPLEILPTIAGKPSPNDALRQYRARLHMRPARDDPQDERAGYYLARPTLQDAQQYYLEDILRDVADDCRRKFDGSWPGRSITALITTVSAGAELIDLAVRVLRPRECLALYSDLFKEAARQVKERIEADRSGPACEVRLKEFRAGQFGPMVAEIRKHLDEFTCLFPRAQIAIDLTPGLKTITLALFRLAPQGSHLVYWDADKHRPTNRAIPFSEVPLHWAAGDHGPWGRL